MHAVGSPMAWSSKRLHKSNWTGAGLPPILTSFICLAQACASTHRGIVRISASYAPSIGPRSSWADLVRVNVTVRLVELIESWQACLGFAAYLAEPTQAPGVDI